MTKTAHTPGPWMAASHASSIVGWPIVGSQGRAIASVHFLPNRPEGISDERWGEYKAECEANAKLIAAAPDLLAALTKAEAHINIVSGAGETDLRAELNAAIAKAIQP